MADGTKTTEDASAMRADAAELAVLGALILVPALLVRIRILLGVDDFFIPAHSVLFEAMLTVFDRHGGQIDLPLLRAELFSSKKLQIVEDLIRLDELEFHGQDQERIEEHARAVHDASQLRRIERFGHMLSMQARQPSARPLERLMWAQEQLTEIERHTGTSRTREPRSVFDELREKMLARLEDSPEIMHDLISHGIDTLDERLDPIQTTEFVIIAAPPGSGKTTAMVQMGLLNAVMKKGVLFVSGEMPDTELAAKMIASLGEIDSRVLFRIKPTQEQYDAAMSQIDHAVSLINDNFTFMKGRFHHSEIRHEVLRLNARPGKAKIRLVLVDYLQLCRPKHEDLNREEAVAENAQGLREIGLHEDVAVVAASAMNRENAKRKGRPQLGDLRESGAVEFAATRIYFLHRNVEDPTQEPAPEEPVDLISAKNRGGTRGDVPLTMISRFCKFEPRV